MNIAEQEIKNAKKIGLQGMLWQTQEECAELINAIAKFNRVRGYGQVTETSMFDAMEKLVEEIADVEICTRHIKYMLEIAEEVARSKEKAIKKVAERYFYECAEPNEETVIKHCHKCVHKYVCLEWWDTDCATCPEESTIEVMSDSWSRGCKNFKKE